jgi:hypothetical protein
MKETETSYTTVIGHGWTGSTIVLDSIAKNPQFTLVESEFCLFWEPGGITDLYNALTNNWDVLVHDYHIRRFLKTCETIQNNGGVLTKWFNNELREQINKNLIDWSINLVNKLQDFTYQNNRFLLDYNEPALVQKLRRIERGVERRLGLNPSATQDYYFCGKEKDEIRGIIFEHLSLLFSDIKDIKSRLLLDQALIFNSLDIASELLSSPKIIVVDRDPRDALVGMIKRNMLFGSKFEYTRQDYLAYEKWSQRLRTKPGLEDCNIYCTTFERFINDHTNEIFNLSAYLGLELNELPKTELNSARSNIGVWDTFLHQQGSEDILEAMGKNYFND